MGIEVFMFRTRFFQRLAPILAGVGLVLATSTIFRWVLMDLPADRREPSHQEKYFEHLEKGLENGLCSEEYCRSAFRHFDRQSDGALLKYGYPELLEAFLVHVASKSDSLLVEWYNPVVTMIRDAREQEPFASLPSDERRLLEAVQLSVVRADSTNGRQQLNELRQLLADRHREYSRIEQQNALTVPLASAGLGATLVLGIWTIVLSARSRKQPIQAPGKRE